MDKFKSACSQICTQETHLFAYRQLNSQFAVKKTPWNSALECNVSFQESLLLCKNVYDTWNLLAVHYGTEGKTVALMCTGKHTESFPLRCYKKCCVCMGSSLVIQTKAKKKAVFLVHTGIHSLGKSFAWILQNVCSTQNSMEYYIIIYFFKNK